MKTKICTKCKEEKSFDEFSPDKRRLDGKASSCRDCCNIKNKKWAKANTEKVKASRKKYENQNPEKVKASKKKYRDTHKEELKIYAKYYCEKYSKQLKINAKKYNNEHKNKHKRYYLKNKKRIKACVKKYREAHKEQYNNYFLKRRVIDIRFKIAGNLRNRVYNTIKRNTKSLSTMMLIGCEIDYLLYHLQSKFTKGMNWDNHGDWHIDHIKPCSKFDLSKPAQQRKCFNYTNLQPLWASDNIAKSDKY